MEVLGTSTFIGLIVIAITQQIKFVSAQVTGVVTAIVAVIIGALVGWLDVAIGLPNITVAQGIWIAVGAIGAHTLASSVSTNIKTPAPKA